MGDPGEKYLMKSIESRLQLKRRLYHFQMKRGISIDEYMNSYTKLLTDLINVDVKIDEEDKAVIILNSLPKEENKIYLDQWKTIDNYNEVSAALVNYEVRRQNRLSSSESTTVETLSVRARSFNRKR